MAFTLNDLVRWVNGSATRKKPVLQWKSQSSPTITQGTRSLRKGTLYQLRVDNVPESYSLIYCAEDWNKTVDWSKVKAVGDKQCHAYTDYSINLGRSLSNVYSSVFYIICRREEWNQDILPGENGISSPAGLIIKKLWESVSDIGTDINRGEVGYCSEDGRFYTIYDTDPLCVGDLYSKVFYVPLISQAYISPEEMEEDWENLEELSIIMTNTPEGYKLFQKSITGSRVELGSFDDYIFVDETRAARDDAHQYAADSLVYSEDARTSLEEASRYAAQTLGYKNETLHIYNQAEEVLDTIRDIKQGLITLEALETKEKNLRDNMGEIEERLQVVETQMSTSEDTLMGYLTATRTSAESAETFKNETSLLKDATQNFLNQTQGLKEDVILLKSETSEEITNAIGTAATDAATQAAQATQEFLGAYTNRAELAATTAIRAQEEVITTIESAAAAASESVKTSVISEITGIKNSVEALRDDTFNLKVDTINLKEDTQAIHDATAALNSNTASLKNAVDTSKASIDQVALAVSEDRSVVSSMKEDLDTSISAVQNSIEEVNYALEDTQDLLAASNRELKAIRILGEQVRDTSDHVDESWRNVQEKTQNLEDIHSDALEALSNLDIYQNLLSNLKAQVKTEVLRELEDDSTHTVYIPSVDENTGVITWTATECSAADLRDFQDTGLTGIFDTINGTDTDPGVLALLDSKFGDARVNSNNELFFYTSKDASNSDDICGPISGIGGAGGAGGGTSSSSSSIDFSFGYSGERPSKISNGQDDCVIGFFWSSKEKEGSDSTQWPETGPGVYVLKIGSSPNSLKVVAESTVDQGEFFIDIKKFLSIGTNTVSITLSNNLGNVSSKIFTIQVVDIYLESNLTFGASYSEGERVVYTVVPHGEGEKKLYTQIDDGEPTFEITRYDGTQKSMEITGLTHGMHAISNWFTIDISGKEMSSEVITREISVFNNQNNTPIIVSNTVPKTVEQNDSFLVEYYIMSPKPSVQVRRILGDSVVEIPTRPTEMQQWEISLSDLDMENGKPIPTEKSFSLQVENITRTYTVMVTPSESASLLPIEAGLVLDLDAKGRDNRETNPDTWNYKGITSTFQNFNFISDGWVKDSKGNSCLRIMGNDLLTINYEPFAENASLMGRTFEFEFAVRDVCDYNSVIMTCLSNSVGIHMTAQKVELYGGGTSLFTQYKDEEKVRVSYVIERSEGNAKIISIYINGIISSVVPYTSNSFIQTLDRKKITFGSNQCVIDLYKIRIYDHALSRQDILTNYIADIQNASERNKIYKRNMIFQNKNLSNTIIVPENLPEDLPYIIFTGDLPQAKGDEFATVDDIMFVDRTHEHPDFNYEGITVKVQGTTSSVYPRKNFKIKLPEKYSLFEGLPGTKTFCLKADYASSEGANNTELVNYYNECVSGGKKPIYQTPPQKVNPNIRQGIKGFPIAVFQRVLEDDTPQFIGKYNFNLDKSSVEDYGFVAGELESWETLENTTPRQLWQSNDYEDFADWSHDFEARYPEDNQDPTYLRNAATFLMSTWRATATNNPLPAPVTLETTVRDSYNELTLANVTFTTDSQEYRLAKFRAEFPNYFDLQDTLFYYIFTELFLMVDSRVKNSFPSVWYNEGKICWLPYDMDTALGINNEGRLEFPADLEDTDEDVFNGKESVLWNNFRDAYPLEIRSAYKTWRKNLFDYDDIIKRFEDHQAKWPIALWNEDAYYKYIDTYIKGIASSTWLQMCLGSKEQQRKWWLFNRFKYLDSKYRAEQSETSVVQFRCYNTSDFEITPNASIYLRMKVGRYESGIERAQAGVTYPIHIDVGSDTSDTPVYFYSADQIRSFGNLAKCHPGTADFSAATKLQELILGVDRNEDGSTYSNPNLKSLSLGSNTLLRKLDVRNSPNLIGTVDASKCSSLEEAYFQGTSLQQLELPKGTMIQKLYLPTTITSLILIGAKDLSVFKVGLAINNTYSSINNTLWIEDPSELVQRDLVRMINQIAEGTLVNLSNFSIEFNSKEDCYAFFDKMDKLSGIDFQGRNQDNPYLIGSIHVKGAIHKDKLDSLLDKYPGLTISYDDLIYRAVFYSYDGSEILYEQNMAAGDSISYEGAQPTRSDTSTSHYVFEGWSYTIGGSVLGPEAFIEVPEGIIVYAVFSDIPIYTVSFFNGRVLLGTASYVGGTPEARGWAGATPTRASTSEWEYSFAGWSQDFASEEPNQGALLNVYEDRALYAVFYKTRRKYTIVFKNASAELYRVQVNYGELPVYRGPATGTLVYDGNLPAKDFGEWVSWAPAVTKVTKDATYTAKYRNLAIMTRRYLDNALIELNTEAIKTIGTYAFTGMSTLEIVNLPQCSSIGYSAFQNCSSLSSLRIPEASQIMRYAFAWCSSLESVDLPATTSMEGSAFYGCSKLAEVSASKISYLPASGFAYCSSLSSIYAPEVTAVGYNCFGNDVALTSITTPKVQTIEGYAFAGCSNLSILNMPKIRTIGSYAFSNCYNLQALELLDCSYLGSYAFYSCINLQAVKFATHSIDTAGQAFTGCRRLDTIYVPSSKYEHYLRTFSAWSSCITAYDQDRDYFYPYEFYYKSSMTELPEGDRAGKGYGRYAFYNCSALSYIPFSECSYVEESAFAHCYSLEFLEGSLATFIGSSAFYNCSRLSTVDLTNCEYLGSYAFAYCSSLTSITDLSNLQTMGSQAFYYCKLLGQISVPRLSNIPNGAFYGCNITSVYAPEISYIGSGAFSYCYSLSQIATPKVQLISDYAFYSARALSAISAPLCSIVGYAAFAGCEALTQVNLLGCQSLGSSAFQNCWHMEYIDLPEVHSIGNNAFADCTKLTAVYLKTSDCTLGTDVFLRDAAVIVYVPRSYVDYYLNDTNWGLLADEGKLAPYDYD